MSEPRHAEMSASGQAGVAHGHTAAPVAPATSKAKAKRSVCLVIALVMGAAYLIYSIVYWSGAATSQGTASAQAGAAIATVLVAPHLVCTLVAVVFNALAALMGKKAFALVAGILYAVAMVLFIAYFFFVIVEMVLCFIGYAKLKKAEVRDR